MSIIQARIRGLALSESDCVLLSKQELDEVLLIVIPLLAGRTGSVATSEFSIGELLPEAVTAKLESLGVRSQTVLACWPAFREGLKMTWKLFSTRFDDFWYPSSDDVIVTSPTVSWVLEFTHEETVRFFQLGDAKDPS